MSDKSMACAAGGDGERIQRVDGIAGHGKRATILTTATF